MLNRFASLALLAAFALPFVARGAAAQDIVRQARRRGVPVPEGYYLRKRQDPHAFEFKRAWKSQLRKAQAQRAAMRSSGLASSSGAAGSVQRSAAVVGTFRVPVLPFVYSAEYSNVVSGVPTPPYAYTDLQQHLFGAGSATSETVTHVYDEMSRGQLTLTGDVFPWIHVSGADTTYEGTTNGLGSKTEPSKIGPLLKAVLDSADKVIDFSQYDSDHDGFVDFVAFVQPEYGGECGGRNLWSHRYVVDAFLGGPYKTNDVGPNGQPIYISDYVLQPALNCPQLGGGMIDIGVFTHEFGHAFGLPDLYSTGNSRPPTYDATNEGIGEWGLMGSGNWNQPSSPAHMEAWSKMTMGWVPVVTVTSDTTITLEPDETTGSIVRINIPGTSEYFLLENRQRLGSDTHLFGTGLLVFHVDSTTIANGLADNDIEDVTDHKGLDVVEADGRDSLDYIGYRGGVGDIFPGLAGATSFTPNTTPNTNSYTNSGTIVASGVSITNIAQSGQNVTFDVHFGPSGVVAVKWGDVNGDGVVNAADYTAVYNCLVGSVCSPDLAISRADVDGDGNITATDALIIHSYVVGGSDVSRYRVGQAMSAAAAPATASGVAPAKSRARVVRRP